MSAVVLFPKRLLVSVGSPPPPPPSGVSLGVGAGSSDLVEATYTDM